MGVCFKGYADVAELLIESGTDLDLQDGSGCMAVIFAAMFGRNGLVRWLLVHDAGGIIVDSRGLSVFDLAAQQDNEEAISLLEVA